LEQGKEFMKTFPLGKMSVHEMEALDVNKKDYKKVFEFIQSYKKSFVEIEIKQYKDDFFYGLHYCFYMPSFKVNSGGFAALRKWGTYDSLTECKKAAIKNVNKSACSEREKALLIKFNLQDIFNED
jgi:hypothetical protein